jgi:hypothetical protein
VNELETAKILAAALKLAESQTKKEVQKLREELDLREAAFAEKLDRIESTEGPSGEKGDRGFIGQTGSQGIQGEQGILGEQGNHQCVGTRMACQPVAPGHPNHIGAWALAHGKLVGLKGKVGEAVPKAQQKKKFRAWMSNHLAVCSRTAP